MSSMDGLGWSFVGFFAGLYLFYQGFRWRKQQQLIEAIPTSKARSVAIGQAELAGKVLAPKKTLVAPFSGKECAYYRCTIEEYRRQGKSSRWVIVHAKSSTQPFYLEDDTGKVLVDPEGAELDVPKSLEFSSSWGKDPDHRIVAYLKGIDLEFEGVFGANKSMRYTEYLLVDGQPIYVMGYAGKNPDVKSSVKNEETIMVQKSGADATFMITTKSEKELLQVLRWKAIGGWLGGGALATVCLAIIFAFFGIL